MTRAATEARARDTDEWIVRARRRPSPIRTRASNNEIPLHGKGYWEGVRVEAPQGPLGWVAVGEGDYGGGLGFPAGHQGQAHTVVVTMSPRGGGGRGGRQAVFSYLLPLLYFFECLGREPCYASLRQGTGMFRPIRELCQFANMPERFAKFIVRFANRFQFANGKKFLPTR